MEIFFVYLLFNLSVTMFGSTSAAPEVKTPLGRIKGTTKVSYGGRKYAAFEGIPYAQPPTRERRFEPPEPIGSWIGNLPATKVASACIQYRHTSNSPDYEVVGDEDCLYLNVYVPASQTSLPVLFTIHGGAFQFGKAYSGVKFLMDSDVIVVSINYRLGSFGFLSTEDEIIPGNMGLKDQSVALRWVYDNIRYFGGDPNRITLFGNSAGGASVHFHYLSPMSRGLFRNGISLSGNSLGPGKQTENSRDKAYKLADILGCPTDDFAEMIECLRYRPARSVAQATRDFMPWLYNPFTPFGPVVEKRSKNAFIDRPPAEIIKSGGAADVLWICGMVNKEGLYPGAEIINSARSLKKLNNHWEKIAPHLLDYNFTIPLDKHAEIARKIRRFYFGTQPICKETGDYLIQMIGDRLYVVDIEKGARLQAKVNKSPVLFYYYSYRAFTSLSDYYSRSRNDYGVSHADDIFMIFSNYLINPPLKARDRAMQLKLIDLVVSVAEKGYPDLGNNVEWKPVTPYSQELNCLHIAGPNKIENARCYHLGQKEFWSEINFDENKCIKNLKF